MIYHWFEPLTTDDETTWSFPGAIVGFVSWLALGIPFLIYGGNTLFPLYSAFLLALDARCGVVGVALTLNGNSSSTLTIARCGHLWACCFYG